MAFTETLLDNRVYQRFAFFANGDGAVGTMDETIDMIGPFEIANILVTFSGVCSADIYLRAKMSAIQSGSTANTYDAVFLSYALSNSTWYKWTPSAVPMLFTSGDRIAISCITDNLWAIVVTGWAATSAK